MDVVAMNKVFEHPEWGTVKLSVNIRARRIVMRACNDGIHMTVPPMATDADIENALAKHGGKLKQMQAENIRVICPQYTVGKGNFQICIHEYGGVAFMWVHEGTKAILMCPENTDYNARQEWLRRAVVNAVADEAKRVLPSRLYSLAEKYGLRYNRCSVRDIHSRWGSCSGDGNISLSIYLVLLPDELIDYVLLHELCHTLEMNHGERFWAALDKLCGCNAKELRGRLKKHFPGI